MTRLQRTAGNDFVYKGTQADLNMEARALGELSKAVTVGYPPAAPGTNGVQAYEDLSGIQTVTTTVQADLKMMKLLPKEPSHSPVFQYIQQNSYGDAHQSLAIAEIARPPQGYANYTRVNENVRQYGRTGSVSIMAANTQSVKDPTTQEVENCATAVLNYAEQTIFHGNSSLNPLEYDGYKKRILTQSPAQNVVDCLGQPLTSVLVDQYIGLGANRINNANFTHLVCTPPVKQAFNRSYMPILRADATSNAPMGFNIDFERYQSSAGTVQILADKFVDDNFDGVIPNYQPVGAPAAPTVSTAPAAGAPASGVTSKFLSSDNGTYFYYAQARNAQGVGVQVKLNTTALNVSGGQVVTFTIQDASPAGQFADYFHIFRTLANGTDGTQQEIARIPNIIANGPQPVSFTDVNFKRPGTSDAFLFQMDAQAMSWVQFLPMMKLDLARVQTSNDFMTLLYGVPTMKAPNRFVLFTNVGTGY